METKREKGKTMSHINHDVRRCLFGRHEGTAQFSSDTLGRLVSDKVNVAVRKKEVDQSARMR